MPCKCGKCQNECCKCGDNCKCEPGKCTKECLDQSCCKEGTCEDKTCCPKKEGQAH